MEQEEKLKASKNGDIEAFNDLFEEFKTSLKSYLYRLLTNREDVEDFYHNVFIKAYEKISTFEGQVESLRSWIFTIATRMCFNYLKQKKRWKVQAQDECRDSLVNNPDDQQEFVSKVVRSTYNHYDIQEHIDFCFTCINKTLTLEKQVAILLKTVYDFKVSEIEQVMDISKGQVKHLLVDARKEMTEIFDGRCALINQYGTCHQCSELQGLFNPKVDFHREASRLKLVEKAQSKEKGYLMELREELVRNVNPMQARGSDLHDYFMQHLKKVNKLG